MKTLIGKLGRTLALAGAFVATTVFGDVAMIDTTGYPTLQEALTAATSGQTVKLTAPAEGQFEVANSGVIVDFNGQTLTGSLAFPDKNFTMVNPPMKTFATIVMSVPRCDDVFPMQNSSTSPYFCANGIPVTFNNRDDLVEGTKAVWTVGGKNYSYNCTRATVIAGGAWDSKLVGDTSIVFNGQSNGPGVFGGGVKAGADVEGNVSVVINSGSFKDGIVGGGIRGNVTGNISVVIGQTNGPEVKITDNVIGGGFYGNVEGDITLTINKCDTRGVTQTFWSGAGVYGNVTGKIDIQVNGGDLGNAMIGGGSMCTGNVIGDTSVTVNGGTVCDVCGGSMGVFENKGGDVKGSTKVAVKGGTVTDTVTGGAYSGTVTDGTSTVEITGGKVGVETNKSGHSYGIFGGDFNVTGEDATGSVVIGGEAQIEKSISKENIGGDTIEVTGGTLANADITQVATTPVEVKLNEETGKYEVVVKAAQVVHGDTTTDYPTFGAAVDAAAAGDTIKLLMDVETAEVEFAKNLVVDFNGKTLTFQGAPAFFSDANNLAMEFKNSGETSATVNFNGNFFVFAGNKLEVVFGDNIKYVPIDTATAPFCANVAGGTATAVVNGGTYEWELNKPVFDGFKTVTFNNGSVKTGSYVVKSDSVLMNDSVAIHGGTFVRTSGPQTSAMFYSVQTLTVDETVAPVSVTTPTALHQKAQADAYRTFETTLKGGSYDIANFSNDVGSGHPITIEGGTYDVDTFGAINDSPGAIIGAIKPDITIKAGTFARDISDKQGEKQIAIITFPEGAEKVDNGDGSYTVTTFVEVKKVSKASIRFDTRDPNARLVAFSAGDVFQYSLNGWGEGVENSAEVKLTLNDVLQTENGLVVSEDSKTLSWSATARGNYLFTYKSGDCTEDARFYATDLFAQLGDLGEVTATYDEDGKVTALGVKLLADITKQLVINEPVDVTFDMNNHNIMIAESSKANPVGQAAVVLAKGTSNKVNFTGTGTVQGGDAFRGNSDAAGGYAVAIETDSGYVIDTSGNRGTKAETVEFKDGAQGVQIEIVSVQQRYPWNGLVDVKYTLSRELTSNYRLTFSVAAGDETIVAKTYKEGKAPTFNKGDNTFTWDAFADMPNTVLEEAEVSLKLEMHD